MDAQQSLAKQAPLPAGEETFSPAMAHAHNYMNWVLAPFRRHMGRRVLEIGVGHGGYGRYLGKLDHYVGLDISADMVARLQRENPAGNYICADITDPAVLPKLQAEAFDTVVCLNVLEHIPDHDAALRQMLASVTPGGHVMVFVPAFQALYSEMDKLAGHCRRYRLDFFERKTTELGATLVDKGYFNALGGLGWWVNKLHKPKTLGDKAVNAQLAFFDRYLVPVARAMDTVTRPFFGQSLYVVLRKS